MVVLIDNEGEEKARLTTWLFYLNERINGGGVCRITSYCFLVYSVLLGNNLSRLWGGHYVRPKLTARSPAFSLLHLLIQLAPVVACLLRRVSGVNVRLP